MVQEINANNIEGIINDNPITCIKFSAEWCPTCKSVADKYKALSEEVDAEVICCAANVDYEPELTDHFNIRSIPTIIIFVKGQETERCIGSDCVDKTREFIKTVNL